MPKSYTIPAIIVVIAAIIGFSVYQGELNGSTAESRGDILNQKYVGAHIVTEAEIDGWIVSGITIDSGEHGLAVFEPKGGGYKLKECFLSGEGTAASGKTDIKNTAYDLFWYNRTDLKKAELTYSVGGTREVRTFSAEDNEIIFSEAPKGSYTVNAVYFDLDGAPLE